MGDVNEPEQASAEVRDLKFHQLDDIIEEARRLHQSGYQQLGRWDLSQICGHLEDWLRFPVEGYPRLGFPLNMALWLLRHVSGKFTFRRIIREGNMSRGTPTLPQTVKSSGDATDAEAIAGLEAAVRQFADHQGEYLPSPVFGKMSREEARQLHLIHAAHHFGFLIPASDSEPVAGRN